MTRYNVDSGSYVYPLEPIEGDVVTAPDVKVPEHPSTKWPANPGMQISVQHEDIVALAESTQNQAVRLAHLESVVHRYINVEMTEIVRALSVRLAELEGNYLLSEARSGPQLPIDVHGPHSLWSCNSCDWIGYMAHTVHPKHDPEWIVCPECHESCDMITDVQFRDIRDRYIGLAVEPAPSVSMET